MKFGIFDHMDRAGPDLGRQFDHRLKLIELYERAGFHAYHLAEHHATPLGMAPSPSVFLAAVAQRTRRLRFGPLVYTVNLYNPLRLIDEICMLDQMRDGRLELGVGRGISPYEVGYYGVDPATGPERFAEAMQVIMKGLTEKRLSHEGKYFTFKDVPMDMQPVQRPHPPLWYGALIHLWRAHGVGLPRQMIPAEFEPALDGGYIIAGSASTVRDRLKRDNEIAGINYCLCRLAFGDLSFEESARSIELLAKEVMPAL